MVRNHHPCYALADLQAMVRQGAWALVNERARVRALALDYSMDQVAKALLALHGDDFRKSIPDCKSDFGLLHCDAYELWFDESAGQRGTQAQGRRGEAVQLYMKLALHTTAEGSCCAVVSFHL